MLSPTRGRSLETFVPAFRAFHLSLSHAKKSYLMTAIPTKPRAGRSCSCLFIFFLVVYLFLYAGTFTWRVSTAILLKSRRLAAATEIRMTGRAQTGFIPAAAAARLEDAAAPPVPGDYFRPVPGDYFRYYGGSVVHRTDSTAAGSRRCAPSH